MDIAQTPKPPYYAVIFTSIRRNEDSGYRQMAEKMLHLAKQQPGFLGVESAREETGITVSYWHSLEDVQHWKQNVEHLEAQSQGRDNWYQSYTVRICRVEKEYSFNAD